MFLNIYITNNAPTHITSVADKCKIQRGVGVSLNTIDQECPGGEGHTPKCTESMEPFFRFYDKYPGNDTTTSILWTGHKLFENGVGENRSFSCMDGINIQCIFEYDLYTESIPVVLHELAHQFGAPDHYHEVFSNGVCRGGDLCSVCGKVGKKRSGTCLMNDVGWLKGREEEDLFCSECVNDMKKHLQETFN